MWPPVLLHQIEPIDRHEELVVAGIAQLHELLRLVADGNALQTDEAADAVVDVDDEIAALEIAEVRQERASDRFPPPLLGEAFFFEHVAFGVELERRLGQPEALTQVPGRDQDGDARFRTRSSVDAVTP